MNQRDPQTIVPGLTIDASGGASVDAALGKLLFDLALQLDDAVSQPVDVEHVLGAIVLASRAGELDATKALRLDDSELLATLTRHIKVVFAKHDGRLGEDD